MKLHIFLIGMPGSGKTKLGRKLASKLNRQFIDTDAYIVAEEGMSVQEIFDQHGESYFRNCEAQAIRKIASLETPLVVATGGGLPCYHDNMEWMNKMGITIYLDVPIGILASRIMESGDRPMFVGMNQTEVEKKLAIILDERLPFYKMCAHVIEFRYGLFKSLFQIFG